MTTPAGAGMYSSSEYSFICLMFSLVGIMLFYGCSFLGYFRLSINYRGVVSVETLPEKKGYENKKQYQKQQSLVISRVRHLECLQMKARLKLKARLTIPLPSCRFTLDQNFLAIPTPLTTPLQSLPSLV